MGRLLQNGILLTAKQQKVVDEAVKWFYHSSEQVFQFAGNPGTGKSVVMAAIIEALGLDEREVAPMAYVGAAAINMRRKGLTTAKTIHSWIYESKEVPLKDKNGRPVMDPYFNRPMTKWVYTDAKLDSSIKLIAIDEGGTVPHYMLKDILSKKVKVLVAGDLDQLPPVKDQPAFLVSGNIHILDEIHRQAANSAIVYLCQRAKNGLPIHAGMYGDEVLVLEEDDFFSNKDFCHRALAGAGVVLCCRNVTRDFYNNYIRHEIRHVDTITPVFGEKILCKSNDWDVSVDGITLSNGLTGVVVNHPDPSRMEKGCFHVDFKIPFTSYPFSDIPVDFNYFISDHEKRVVMKSGNILRGKAFEWGYTQTVHVSQGSQWRNGIFFEESISNFNKVVYTALSRFSEKCIYIKAGRKYR